MLRAMNSFRIAALVAAAFCSCAALLAAAQAPNPAPPLTEAEKAAAKAPKKTVPKADAAKAPAKDAAKPAKDAAKPAPKAPAKAPPKAPPKDAPATRQAPKVYTTGPTELRDKQGNVIPTNPDAYNVDSALPKKK